MLPKRAIRKSMNNINSNKKEFTSKQREELLRALKARFEKNMNRHKGLEWAKVQARLEANAKQLWSLNEMKLGCVLSFFNGRAPISACII